MFESVKFESYSHILNISVTSIYNAYRPHIADEQIVPGSLNSPSSDTFYNFSYCQVYIIQIDHWIKIYIIHKYAVYINTFLEILRIL